MRVLLDATVLQYPATGIAKSTVGLYRACLAQDPGFEAVAVHRRPLMCGLPDRMRDLAVGGLLPPRIWRTAGLSYSVVKQHAAAVHFPWNGGVPRLPRPITVITTLHDVLPLEIPGYFGSDAERHKYHAARQRDISRSHLVITDSVYSQRKIREEFATDREPVVIYHGPVLSTPPFPDGPDGYARRYFLYVGGYDRRKGLEKLLEVFLSLWYEGRVTTPLVLVGGKRHISASFEDLVEAGVCAGAVEERGYVTDAELAALYAGAVALVYPSKYEGFGMPPLEAMALGCPVVTTPYTSLPEICGDAALFVDPDDGHALAHALIRLEQDAALGADLQARGRRRAAKFSWEVSAQKFLRALEETQRRRAEEES